MIIWETPYHIKVKLFDKEVRIQGEALSAGAGFVLYRNSIKHWEAPYEDEYIDEDVRELIIQHVLNDSNVQGYRFEFE